MRVAGAPISGCFEKEKVMKAMRYGLAVAAKEHLAKGDPITRLEALVLYGVSNLPDVVKEMRAQGWVVQSRLVPYAAAAARVNKFAVLQPPSNLPVREVQLTEYWVSR
jgi:hypothetical protein